MQSEQFCYWLKGFIDLTGTHPTEDQWSKIKVNLSNTLSKAASDQYLKLESNTSQTYDKILMSKLMNKKD